ncbi:MAG: hypothetical protein K2X82_28140 [Gemmataceae bacterium]|nr:hypothetical protein [Gemmataceae bacterium]
MANLDETGTPPGDGRNGEPHDTPPAADGPSRLQELERENARLRTELAELKTKHQVYLDILADISRDELPATEEEFLRGIEGPSISDIIREFEQEHGLGGKP